jgi:hypothetical protein
MGSGVRTTSVKRSFQQTLGRTHTEPFKAMREFFDNSRAVKHEWNAANVYVDLLPWPSWKLQARALACVRAGRIARACELAFAQREHCTPTAHF